MEIIIKLKIKEGLEGELTIEELEKLYNDLGKLLNKQQSTYIPYYPYTDPIRPFTPYCSPSTTGDPLPPKYYTVYGTPEIK